MQDTQESSTTPSVEKAPAKGRDVWHSRLAFLFASLGCAVGFGNVWRFPTLAYEYGGGAFLIPYALALLFVGVPLLVLEISLGQYHQRGNIQVFGSVNIRLRGIGLASVVNTFIVVCFYSMLIAWTTRSFFSSLVNPSSWTLGDGDDAFAFFLNEIVGMSTLDEDFLPTRLVWLNAICLFLVWLFIYLGTAYGLEWTGKITYVTMGVPMFLMFVLLIRAVTLEGAADGIKAYVGEWDFGVFKERPDIWSTAVSQIFFSLGITFGMFTAFGSHCQRDAPAFENSVIIALCNSAFSLISGFSIFGALGYLAYSQGVELEDIVVGGPALVFGAYPDVLETIPGGVFWIRLLFFDLFLLGIDSAFAMVESIATVLGDSQWCRSIPSHYVTAGVCGVGFVCSCLYANDAGLVFLQVVDFYVNFVMIAIGLLECVALGWIYGIQGQMTRLGGEKPVLIYMATSFVSVIVACFVWFAAGAAFWWGLLVWVLGYGGGTALAIHQHQSTSTKEEFGSLTTESILRELALGNIAQLKEQLESVVGRFPLWVAILVKHVIPQVLLILFVNLAVTKGPNGLPLFGNYKDYVFWPFQLLGIFVVLLSFVLVVFGAWFPSELDGFDNERETAATESLLSENKQGNDETGSFPHNEQSPYSLMEEKSAVTDDSSKPNNDKTGELL